MSKEHKPDAAAECIVWRKQKNSHMPETQDRLNRRPMAERDCKRLPGGRSQPDAHYKGRSNRGEPSQGLVLSALRSWAEVHQRVREAQDGEPVLVFNPF
jgi:hypothetical protein